jgi:hypothetical protein
MNGLVTKAVSSCARASELLCIVALLCFGTSSPASPRFDGADPLGFFTNVTAELLLQLNLHDSAGERITITNIPVYPTNYYTPSVHRLLQVTANIFEGTTTNLYPCIYRPFFSSDGTNVVIRGYQLVNGPDNEPTSPSFLTIPVDLSDSATRASISNGVGRVNVYGVPWVIGARKGFPNLNEVVMQSVSQISRMLQVIRPLVRNGWSGYSTKQLFVIGVSNSLAVEFWNSYRTNYPRPVYIQADGCMAASLTNDLGFVGPTVRFALFGNTNLGAGEWAGAGMMPDGPGILRLPSAQSFIVPLLTNFVLFPDCYAISNELLPVASTQGNALWTSSSTRNLGQPQWMLNVANNIRCVVMDGGSDGRVIDYVQLSHLEAPRNLSDEAVRYNNVHNVWVTNMNTLKQLWMDVQTVPEGILHQILVSMGLEQADATEWRDYSLGGKTNDIAGFFSFLIGSTVMSNSMPVPFTPTSKVRQLIKWQANDPLVHYLTEDIVDLNNKTDNVIRPPNNPFPLINSNLWQLNRRFSPWDGNPAREPDPLAYYSALKDPLVRTSDEWNFPTNEPLSFAMIGRVHRGTPWQTIYLKASDVDLPTWKSWTGDSLWLNGIYDFNFSRPVKDRDLISLLWPLLSTNDPSRQLSINNSDPAAWLATLDGLEIETNSTPATTIVLSSNSPSTVLVAQAVAGSSGTNTAFPGQRFAHFGDLLAVPQLSEQSPFLDTSALYSRTAGGLNDEVFESLPTKLLPLLRDDSFGALVQSNGQLAIQFTGNDYCSYLVQASPDLVHWVNVATNFPVCGSFGFRTTPIGSSGQFYRSIRLP